MSISVRATAAHEEADTPEELFAQAKTYAAQQLQAAKAQTERGVQVLKAKVTATVQAVESALKGNPTSKDLALVNKALGAVQSAVALVGSDHKQAGAKLLDNMPALIQQFLPGVEPKALKKAFTVGRRIMSMLRKPSFHAAAGVLKELGIGRSSSVMTFLLDGIANVLDGQPFQLSRFLPGALQAVSKDLTARAQTLLEGEDYA